VSTKPGQDLIAACRNPISPMALLSEKQTFDQDFQQLKTEWQLSPGPVILSTSKTML